jgi:hypothetical protein
MARVLIPVISCQLSVISNLLGVKIMNKENLSNFHGTENYYSNKNYPFEYTDGVKYVAENGKAYWLLDAIASWQKKLDSSQIQFWMLIVNSDKSAVLTCEQDNESVITQQIPFTEFPFSEVTLWLCDGILLLSSEY